MISWNMSNDRIMAELEKKQEEYPIHSNLAIKSPNAFKPEEKSIIQEHIDNLWRQEVHNTEMWILCEMAKRYINGVPTGRWKKSDELFTEEVNWMRCSVCNHKHSVFEVIPNFCPNCGTRMVAE